LTQIKTPIKANIPFTQIKTPINPNFLLTQIKTPIHPNAKSKLESNMSQSKYQVFGNNNLLIMPSKLKNTFHL
jgi:hypothetical protein